MFYAEASKRPWTSLNKWGMCQTPKPYHLTITSVASITPEIVTSMSAKEDQFIILEKVILKQGPPYLKSIIEKLANIMVSLWFIIWKIETSLSLS